MPKLPVVKSRQSRVSGQPSQVAGALIPDNTQHSWRDDVGKRLAIFVGWLCNCAKTKDHHLPCSNGRYPPCTNHGPKPTGVSRPAVPKQRPRKTEMPLSVK